MTPAVTRPVLARDALGTLTKLGQGGQGIVYQTPKVTTPFAPAMVFKEYKPHARAGVNFDALSAMPTLVEETLPYHDGQALVSIAAWPCALVENGTGPVGFVMPAIPDLFAIDLTTVKGVSRTRAEFQHLLNPPSVLAARGITLTDLQRYALLREVAKALAFLHRIGVCVGDISPKNLLFSLNPRPAVYFIDCDTMRINGISAVPQVETPDWAVPAGEETATVHSDTYKLGLLALRLLAGDQHTKNVQQLPSTTPKLLRQLITDTLTNEPDRRPLPEAWTYLLGHTLEEVRHRAPTPPAPTAPKPAPSTHVPESQPVVPSRPRATPGKNRVAATVSASPTPASTQPATQSRPKSRRNIWVARAAVIVLIAVIALVKAHAHSFNGLEMIHGFALVGAVAGIGFVVLAAWGARVIGRSARLDKTPPESWCGLRSPDDKLMCCQEISHAGSCQNGASQWRQSVWYARPEGDDPLVTEIPKSELRAEDWAFAFSAIGYAVLVVVLFVHACYEQVVSWL